VEEKGNKEHQKTASSDKKKSRKNSHAFRDQGNEEVLEKSEKE